MSEDNDMHADLMAAFDAVESGEGTTPEVINAPVEEVTVPEVIVPPVEETLPLVAEKEVAPEIKPEDKKEEITPVVADKNGDPITPATTAPVVAKGIKAPAGWTPQQREQWSKVPPEIQESITAREKEIAANMSNTAESRKTHERMEKLGQSYAPVMAAEGVADPIQAAEGLFQTVAQLQNGNAQQKAQTIADLVKHYSVDINSLDTALVGGDQTPAATPEQAQMEKMLEQKMQPFNQMMAMVEQAKTQGQEQVQVDAQKSVQDFAKNAEFLGDVRNDMADLIDASHARGKEMTLQDAYSKAVILNPDISKILEQRKIIGNNNNIQTKKAAATSLSGRKTGVIAKPTNGSLRDDLEAAMESWG